MKFRYCMSGVIAGAVILAASAATARAADRLSDKEVKALIDQVDTGRDKFEGNLDGTFKGSTLTGPNGETKVAAALQDYQDNTKKLQQRFSSDYAAGPEVATVLRQSTLINKYMTAQPSSMKGRIEWDRQTENLKHLAEVYGTTFPLPDGATCRRVNDQEAAGLAGSVAAQAEQVKNAAKADKTLAKPDKQALLKQVDAVSKQAKTLESRLKDGKPAAADARALMDGAAALTAEGRQLPAAVMTAIGGLRAPLLKLDEAFGVTPATTP